MKIEHIAIWAKNLEQMRDFYIKYFDMKCSEKYINPTKKFSSYFLSFENEKTRIEIMSRPDIAGYDADTALSYGLCHLSISVGGKQKVDALTEQLRKDGFTIYSEPRTTGDGYYESVIVDYEGNHIEITE